MTVAPLIVSSVYPDCDGNPMSDNTVQFRWIVLLKENMAREAIARGDKLAAQLRALGIDPED
jgi:hypothetical protein